MVDFWNSGIHFNEQVKKINVLIDKIISKYRWIVVVGTVGVTALLGVGVKNMENEI